MKWISAVETPSTVTATLGIVYSTAPTMGLGADGAFYYLKGPQAEVVFSEAVCYEFANELGLRVPPCALCQLPEKGVFFASRQMRIRSGVEALIRRQKVSNPELLADMVAFDVWVVNIDRNLGNIVAEPHETAGAVSFTLYAIDFEKAQAVCGTDRFTVGALDPRKLWPTDELGTLCRASRIPQGLCSRVRGLGRDKIVATVERAIWDLGMPTIEHKMTSIDMLTQRAEKIESLVSEVWNA